MFVARRRGMALVSLILLLSAWPAVLRAEEPPIELLCVDVSAKPSGTGKRLYGQLARDFMALARGWRRPVRIHLRRAPVPRATPSRKALAAWFAKPSESGVWKTSMEQSGLNGVVLYGFDAEAGQATLSLMGAGGRELLRLTRATNRERQIYKRDREIIVRAFLTAAEETFSL